MSIGIVQDQGDTTNMKHVLHEHKDHCTLTDYYLDELKATPSMYITNAKLVLAGKEGGAQWHIKQAADFLYSIEVYLGLHYCIISDASGVFHPPACTVCH